MLRLARGQGEHFAQNHIIITIIIIIIIINNNNNNNNNHKGNKDTAGCDISSNQSNPTSMSPFAGTSSPAHVRCEVHTPRPTNAAFSRALWQGGFSGKGVRES
ncbi:hypothetical protein DFH27DRAFT_529387 [Peziza echinospora]|nr:hypothetical protein DFH27DRAFT_529387 [Peziza echinospora]